MQYNIRFADFITKSHGPSLMVVRPNLSVSADSFEIT
jgi:hypothetical protein